MSVPLIKKDIALTIEETMIFFTVIEHAPKAIANLKALIAMDKKTMEAGLHGKWSAIAAALLRVDMVEIDNALTIMLDQIRWSSNDNNHSDEGIQAGSSSSDS